MIEVMVIEDDERIRILLKKMIEKTEGFTVVSEAGTVSEALDKYREKPVGVVMADIDLAGESGLMCARKICDLNPKVKIVFTTAHSEFMADAFEIYAFDYIVKPYNIDRVNRTLLRIRELHKEEGILPGLKEDPRETAAKNDKLVIKNRDEINFIDIDEIVFIERVDGTSRIVTLASVYQTGASLTDLFEKLDQNKFIRSHRSYILNMTKIEKLTQYGRWTYCVSFKGTDETALLTYDNFERLKKYM